jgi:sugar/nucleoside kinase (ribokinase family)
MKFPFSLDHDKEFDAVGFGLNAVDHLVVVPEYPAFDSKIRFTDYAQAAGGQTATAMVGLQRLGLRTAYVGRFGADNEGVFGRATLLAEDVDVSRAEIVPDARTQLAFIIIDGRNGERTIIWDRDERLAYRPEEVPAVFLTRGRVLHLDAHDPPACVVAANAARASDVVVSADVDNIYPGCEELLPFVDVLIASKDFPQRLTGLRDKRQALREIRARYGCAVAGMTLGTDGALLLVEDAFIEAPAYAAPGGAKDTTGAGDAFHAGFLYGLLTGEDVETALRLAHAVAALKCRALGARTTLPTPEELREFLESV